VSGAAVTTFEIRLVEDSELGAFRDALMDTFGFNPEADPGGEDRLFAWPVAPWCSELF